MFAFKKCVLWCPWPRSWSWWVLSATSGPVTKSVVLARCMGPGHPRVGASRPTSSGTSTTAFAADPLGTTSTCTQLPRTSRCLQLQSISALVLDVPFRGSRHDEPASAKTPVASWTSRWATWPGPPSDRENGLLSDRDQHFAVRLAFGRPIKQAVITKILQ